MATISKQGTVSPLVWRVAGRRIDIVILLILLVALLARVRLAMTEPYIYDEDNTAIPISQTISFAPGHLHLPMRGENHPVLPAYFVKASSTIFGTTRLGYRSVHILASLCTIVLIVLLTGRWYGPIAARWAAALLAFNEYYLNVSARATAHAPHLLLLATSMYAFSRFLAAQRVVYLYAAGAAVGLAFYCKEHSAILLPVFLLTLLHARYRHWLRSPHVYLACATFFLVIAPDVVWNLTNTHDIEYVNRNLRQATYASHLQRIGGLGFSPYPLMFYGRTAVMSVNRLLTGKELNDDTPEYRSINPALGALFLGAVLVTTFRGPRRDDDVRRFLLVLFWFVFVFFTLIRPGDPQGRLAPVSWIWVDITMFPAVILTGALLAGTSGTWRIPAWAFAAGALLYAGTLLIR